jgi:hypothetical protein
VSVCVCVSECRSELCCQLWNAQCVCGIKNNIIYCENIQPPSPSRGREDTTATQTRKRYSAHSAHIYPSAQIDPCVCCLCSVVLLLLLLLLAVAVAVECVYPFALPLPFFFFCGVTVACAVGRNCRTKTPENNDTLIENTHTYCRRTDQEPEPPHISTPHTTHLETNNNDARISCPRMCVCDRHSGMRHCYCVSSNKSNDQFPKSFLPKSSTGGFLRPPC